MVRRMSLYDINGHRVRTQSQGNEEGKLPPISAGGSRRGSGDTGSRAASRRGTGDAGPRRGSGESRRGSLRGSASSNSGSQRMSKAPDTSNDPNRLRQGKEITGVLYRVSRFHSYSPS